MTAIRQFVAMFIVLVPAASFAESTGDDQAAVWTAVERIWSAGERGDLDRVDSMLSADFMGWPMDSPAPRSKGSTRMWARFGADHSKGLAHELYPLSIVVHGDMAVVHYLYKLAVQNGDKRTVMSSGRYTDILVRDGNDWKFISWHGGDDLALR